MSTQQFLNACLDSMRSQSFYPAYQNAFRVLRADSNALKEIAFRLRYEVFCVENSIDTSLNNNIGQSLEKDAYDDHSLHYLLYHKATDEAVGTVRVVLPREDKILHSFPMQFICDHPLLHMQDRVSRFCEISHLCMSKSFRKRPGDGHVLPAYYEQDSDLQLKSSNVHMRRMIPFAPLGLLRAAFEGALDKSLTDCICVMDHEQLYALQRIGLSYRVLGPRLDRRGQQQPVIFNIKHALDNMILQNAPCWEIVSDRGRLHLKANELEQNAWHDEMFDEKCMNMIFERLEGRL